MLPFWLTVNQFGVVASDESSANLRLSFTSSFKSDAPIAFKMGIDAIGRGSKNSTAFLQQLYGEATWGPFLLRAGRKEETDGHVHPTLSLGSMVLSKNAAPITGISLSWPDFVTIPGTGTFLAVKGGLKHGWIDGYRITTNPLLHAKSFYLRLGFDRWPVHGYAGVLHYAMWAGTHRQESIGDLPSSLGDYLRVFFFRGAKEGTAVDGEVTNALGNSLGIYDFALEIVLEKMDILAYRQFYLEDTVGTRFRSGWDGLWGLGFTFHTPSIVKEILWEHVNTKRQSSKVYELPGTDNYYNHFIYASGWTHRGRSLGSPVILNRQEHPGVFNNILLAQHIAIHGAFTPLFNYRLMYTWTRNYGANSIHRTEGFGFTSEGARFDKAIHQQYAGLELTHLISQQSALTVFTRLAYDWGELLPENNFGVTLGILRTGGF